MARKVRVAIVGGGSFNWSPTILRDVMLTEGLEGTEFRLLDIDRRAAETVARLGRKLARDWDLPAEFLPTTSPGEALAGCDFVIITISTGGLAAMKHDLRIPERYGIYHTVGDTVGPGGWARALRNIPVFVDLGRQIRRLAPKAVILNYTNPLTVLTRTLTKVTEQPVVGLCHGLYENYRMLQALFGLSSEEEIEVRVGGLNHFFWIIDLKIRGRDGYAMLRRKLKRSGMSLADAIRRAHGEGAGFHRNALVTGELFERFGYLTYCADRHTVEFFGRYITSREALARYRIVRTTIADRRAGERARARRMRDWLTGKLPFPRERSREAAADIIRAFTLGRKTIDVMNVPNRGQIPNLPAGAVVETLGVVSPLGFTPLTVGPLPEPVADLVRRHATNQELLVEAGMEGDLEKAFAVLANDPLCGHLPLPAIREMGERLLAATRRWLPRTILRRLPS